MTEASLGLLGVLIGAAIGSASSYAIARIQVREKEVSRNYNSVFDLIGKNGFEVVLTWLEQAHAVAIAGRQSGDFKAYLELSSSISASRRLDITFFTNWSGRIAAVDRELMLAARETATLGLAAEVELEQLIEETIWYWTWFCRNPLSSFTKRRFRAFLWRQRFGNRSSATH